MTQPQMTPEQERKLKAILELSRGMERKMQNTCDRLLLLDQKLETRIAQERVQ